MNEIKKWRKNADLTQSELATIIEADLRTVEAWEQETRKPPRYAEKLLIEKLMDITEKTMEKNMKKEAAKAPKDENGKKAIISWVTIEEHSGDEFIECFSTMKEAIEDLEHYPSNKKYVTCILCNENENGKPEPWFADRKGNVWADHTPITL